MFCKGRAYSDDLRWRIVQMKAINWSDADIAARFCVSTRTVQRFAVTGTVALSLKRNGPIGKLTSYNDSLMSSILNKPTRYLHELQQHLEDAHGVIPRLPTISRHFKKMGIARKKVKGLAVQQTESVHLSFMAEISVFEPSMLI